MSGFSRSRYKIGRALFFSRAVLDSLDAKDSDGLAGNVYRDQLISWLHTTYQRLPTSRAEAPRHWYEDLYSYLGLEGKGNPPLKACFLLLFMFWTLTIFSYCPVELNTTIIFGFFCNLIEFFSFLRRMNFGVTYQGWSGATIKINIGEFSNRFQWIICIVPYNDQTAAIRAATILFFTNTFFLKPFNQLEKQ